ncbi:MAG: DivIVA domain-containing protein, partial [Mycobacterium sp.]
FLGLIEQRIEARNQLSAHDVRNVGFNKPPLFRRGYDEDEVDTFLDLATDTIAALEERQR